MRTLISLLTLLIGGICSATAVGHPLLHMEIIDRNQDAPLETYFRGGKTYVAGNPGDRYAIRLTNRSSGRVLAVLSVDGVNVVSGETANPRQTGYILEPYQSFDVAGWRKSDREVAQFFFTALPNSYAARTHRPDNVGVIGLAAFREKTIAPPPISFEPASPRGDLNTRDAASSPAPASAAGAPARNEAAKRAQPAESRIGTGHGQREYAPVTTVEFERRSPHPDQVLSVFYDSRANLIARGILPQWPRYPEPRAFPGRYVPDPEGY